MIFSLENNDYPYSPSANLEFNLELSKLKNKLEKTKIKNVLLAVKG